MTELLTDAEAEQAMIGAALVDNSLLLRIDLEPDDFVSELHQRVWGLVREAVNRGSSVTAGQLSAQAPELEKYLKACADFGHTALRNVATYARSIRDLSARRRLKGLAEEFAEQLSDPGMPTEEAAATMIGELQRMKTGRPARSKRDVAIAVVEGLRKPAHVYGTGMPTLDSALGGGLFSGKAYGFAARKKVGKTVLLGTLSHNLNRAQIPHLFIAMEMSPEEIEQRSMARDIGINSIQFLKRQNPALPSRAAEYACDVPNCTFYEHAPGASLDEVRRMVGKAIVQHGIKGIFLDYWQLVGGKQRNETEEYHLRNVAQWVADVCRRENLFAVIAAQVNQDGNTRGGEGMKLACDVYFTLHREKDSDHAWLEMEESRYVLYTNIGSDLNPGLMLNKHGPFFEDCAPAPVAPQHWSDRESA